MHSHRSNRLPLRTIVAVAAIALFAGLTTVQADGERSERGTAKSRLEIQGSAPVTPFVIDVDLRDLPAPRQWQPGDPIRDVPKRRFLPPGTELPIPDNSPDELAARQRAYSPNQRGLSTFTVPDRNFPGISFTGAGVPDTIGDVGMNYIIQATNGGGSTIHVWDKAVPSPNLVSTFVLDSLGTGVCANGLGDPVVIYDRNALRWVLMEFVGGGNNLCVYVSQTEDPVTGGWYGYNFLPPSFPDYPKLGVWPTDANGGDGSYVVTANAGVAAYAMERGPMLTGDPAEFLIFDLPNLSGFGFQTATQADIDGPDLPPAGAPAVIMRHRDTEVHGGPGSAPGDLLEMWALDIDWQTTGNSSLTQTASIDVADFSSELCGLVSFSCIEQPNTATDLDPLREVIMNRLQYIHHGGDFETLMGNFVIDVNGTEQGGIRWFELRRTGGAASPWTLYQEGTYTIDSDSRWMGASSMDQSGNIALAYNVSSNDTFPSLRYTGRQFDDPPGVMTAPETSIAVGTSSSGTNRYGDYAAMGLDPVDDCTFWFTGEYNVASSWSTRWASFRFDTCGCLLEPGAPTLGVTDAGNNQIDLAWDDADLDSVIAYEIRRSRNQGGPYETIAEVPDTSPGVAGGPGYTFADTSVSGGLEYFYVVVASDGGACKSDAINEVSGISDGLCLLRPTFDGITSALIDVDSTCGIQVGWNPATPECGAGVLYNLYRSTDPDFIPGPTNLVSGGISGTSVLDQNGLASGQEYFYAVRALDTSNVVEDLNQEKASAVAGGAGGQNTFFLEDLTNAADFNNWTVSNGPGNHRCGEWGLSTTSLERPTGGSGQYALSKSQQCDPLLPTTSTKLDSPAMDLSSPSVAAVVLDFDIYYNHFDGDDSTVEVWDGAQWVVIWSDPNSDLNTKLSFDVSAYALGNSSFRVRFNYQNANSDRWYAVDNVRVGVDLVCDTSSAPSPAPDGAAATSALRGERLNLAGDSVEVTWDTSCGATEYNLLYGHLDDVGDYTLLGSRCSIGGSGSYTWSAVPAGSVYFLIVGGDGSGVESSWGLSSFGERNGLTGSGQCGTNSKVVTSTCP